MASVAAVDRAVDETPSRLTPARSALRAPCVITSLRLPTCYPLSHDFHTSPRATQYDHHLLPVERKAGADAVGRAVDEPAALEPSAGPRRSSRVWASW